MSNKRRKQQRFKVIEGDREKLREEIFENLVNMCVYRGKRAERAKKKIYEIDRRLSRRANLKLVVSNDRPN
jgi:hypothetical protein